MNFQCKVERGQELQLRTPENGEMYSPRRFSQSGKRDLKGSGSLWEEEDNSLEKRYPADGTVDGI